MKYILSFILIILATACTTNTTAITKTFEVTCPLNMTQIYTDTIRVPDGTYYYYNSSLNIRSGYAVTVKQYPATCIVKELN